MSARAACWVWIAIASCAPVRAKSPVLDATSVADAERLHAPERAPDLWALSKQAAERAERAGVDPAAVDDARTEARLWLAAASAEAARIELSETRSEHERSAAATNAATVRLEAERAGLAEQAAQAAAAATALAEARAALEHALSSPSRVPKPSAGAEQRAAIAVLDRAALVIAAGRALGADDARSTALEARGSALRTRVLADPHAALLGSDALLFEAHALLGPLRLAAGTPDDAMKRALADELTVAGTELVRNDRGLGVRIAAAFRSGAAFDRTKERLVGRVCALALAHPFGPVQAVAGAPDPRIGQARKRALEAVLLAQGCPQQRLSVEVGGSAHGDDLELTFVAY